MINLTIYAANGKLHCDPIQVNATTRREALNALKLTPEFDPKLTTKRYQAEVKGCNQLEDLDEPLQGQDLEIHITREIKPRELAGSGDNAAVRIVIGIILIVVAIYAPMLAPEVAQILGAMGASLVIGGLVQLLTPTPKSSEDDRKNNSTNTYVNTVASGTPIPIILGEHLWGGHVLNAGIDTTQRSEGYLQQFAVNLWTTINAWDSWDTLYSSPNLSSVGYNQPNYQALLAGGGKANWADLKML